MPFGALNISTTLELRRANENPKIIVACTQSKETHEIVFKDYCENSKEQRKYKVKEIDYR